jgi:hypothetical protein
MELEEPRSIDVDEKKRHDGLSVLIPILGVYIGSPRAFGMNGS